MSTKSAVPKIDEAALRVKVAARMEQLKISQTDVAKLSGFSQGKLSAWLGGHKKIRLDSLAKILQAVGLGLLVQELSGAKPKGEA